MSYKIGEIAKLTNLTTRTIRYYEGLGLLGTRKNRSRGQSRLFDNDDIKRLKKIQMLKDLGLTLEEIGKVIELYFTDAQLLEGKRQVVEILRNHIAAAEEKIEELNMFKTESQASIFRIESIIKNSKIENKNKK
ncbi:MAG: MerR family transcriptional regulator [Clostridium sp.]|jgi:DNA-binding transcriptional MerR regulator|uniref:helix-turn-helix domain-containing protein n=1 Tax=Clostridium sp. TaxID=1506 RepID=UPI0025C6A9A8|nr:MerR family transcriptional regulator [Clostridium sp.]MCH3965128.1 MerR family transcriptional regulator [Clostridium sp.]MCI1714349.1 MerR family transcriptional regulator [Clostridium sp.]MCI1798611.1 MerR family transcriptional regulator [Clostridium sp.]MCI1812658.1 MerR family transcriptional regulator [Clostridium sp.]MCI1869420.1 MerR family transcriptional regulator [Clostridium sp.]